MLAFEPRIVYPGVYDFLFLTSLQNRRHGGITDTDDEFLEFCMVAGRLCVRCFVEFVEHEMHEHRTLSVQSLAGWCSLWK